MTLEKEEERTYKLNSCSDSMSLSFVVVDVVFAAVVNDGSCRQLIPIFYSKLRRKVHEGFSVSFVQALRNLKLHKTG